MRERLLDSAQRNPTTIKHPPAFMNAIEELTRQHSRAPLATYYARWSTGRNGKGAKGLWSMPAAMTVVASQLLDSFPTSLNERTPT